MLSLKTHPDPILDTPCVEVAKEEIAGLHESILEATNIMMENGGIGIAANQVGLDKRFIVVSISGSIIPMINPVISNARMNDMGKEGCLSFPGVTSKVMRNRYIDVTYLDLKGEEQTLGLSYMNARVVQHEVEHLDGRNFLRQNAKKA